MGRNLIILVAACALAGAQTPPADQAFRQGSEAYRAGNCPAALPQLAQAKGTPRALLLMGRCYLDMGDYAKARTALEQYNQAVPGDEETLILLARAAENAGGAALASAMLEQLRQQAPSSLAAQDALAQLYAKSGKPQQATPIYQAVLATDPRDVGALAGLAEIALAASQWDAAIAQYKKVLDLSPDNTAANAAVGRAQLQLGHVDAAIPYLLRASRLRPGDWKLAKSLADCYVKTAKWKDAIQAIEYDSLTHADDEEVTGWMVQAFGQAADAPHAEQYYRAILQKATGNFTARLTLANLLYDGKRPKEAEEQYILVLKAKPDLYEISDRVGQIAEQENNFPEALQYYAAACRSASATLAMKTRLARLYFRTGDMANARTSLETVLQAEPDNRDIKAMLMQVAVKTDRADDAVHYATDLLPGDPNNVSLLRLLGEDALKRNNVQAAADFLERAQTVDEKDRSLRFELVGIYTDNDSLDKLPRAFDLMNEYVGLYPEDYEGYLLLANLYRRKGDAADAHDYFARGFNRMPAKPPARMSWAYISVGVLWQTEGKTDEAIAAYQKALEINPADASAVYNMALVYLKLKRKADVNDARERLSQMNAPELLTELDDRIQRSKINK